MTVMSTVKVIVFFWNQLYQGKIILDIFIGTISTNGETEQYKSIKFEDNMINSIDEHKWKKCTSQKDYVLGNPGHTTLLLDFLFFAFHRWSS